MKLIERVKSALFISGSDAATDNLATLVIAAREDTQLRTEIENLLSIPDSQRASWINSAVEEMKLKGEPVAVCTAFLILATSEGAETVRQALQS